MTIEKCIIAFTNLENEPDLYCFNVKYQNNLPLEELYPKVEQKVKEFLNDWCIYDTPFIIYLESDVAFVGFAKDIIDWDFVEVIELEDESSK